MSCYQKIKEELKNLDHTVPDSVIRDWEKTINDKAQQMSKAELEAAVKKIVDEDLTRYAKQLKASKLLDRKIYASVEEGYRSSMGKMSAYEYARAVLEGGALKSGDGVNLNVRGYEHTLMSEFVQMYNQLDKFKKEFELGQIDRDIIQEKNALQSGQPVGASGNKLAAEVAKVFHAIQNRMFDLQKAVSPTLKYLNDYFFEQTHSMDKIKATPKAQWVMDAMRHFGEKSYTDLTPEAKVAKFEKIYDSIVDGTFSYSPVYGNKRFSLSASRELLAKDWAAFADYHAKYGEGSLSQVMLNSMSRAASQVAQIEKFGSNPDKFMSELINRISRAAPEKEVKELKGKISSLQQMLDTNTGANNSPAEGVLKIVQTAQEVKGMALSGKTVISSMPDLVLSAGLIKDTLGKSMLTNVAELMSAFAKAAANPAEAQAAMLKAGVFFESYRRALARDIGSGVVDKTVGGRAKKAYGTMVDVYSKVTLINKYMEASRAAIATVIADHLGEISTKAWTKLDAKVKDGFRRYGIDGAEWALIRRTARDVEMLGQTRKVITPEAAKWISDEDITTYLTDKGEWKPSEKRPMPSKPVLDKARQELGLKIGALINEHVDIGTSTIQARQKRFLYRGTSPNDGMGMVLRLAGQFKGASLVAADALRRRYYSQNSDFGRFGAVAQSATGLLFMGAMAQYAADAALGKTPEDPTNPEFIMKVMARSGMGGPIADALIREVQMNGVDQAGYALVKSALGPVLSSGAEGIAIATQAGKAAVGPEFGGPKYPTKKALNWATSSIPFQNVFWAQGLLNAALLNSVKEDIDSGFSGQFAKRLRETPGLFTDSGHQEIFIPIFDPSGGK